MYVNFGFNLCTSKGDSFLHYFFPSTFPTVFLLFSYCISYPSGCTSRPPPLGSSLSTWVPVTTDSYWLTDRLTVIDNWLSTWCDRLMLCILLANFSNSLVYLQKIGNPKFQRAQKQKRKQTCPLPNTFLRDHDLDHLYGYGHIELWNTYTLLGRSIINIFYCTSDLLRQIILSSYFSLTSSISRMVKQFWWNNLVGFC